MALTLQVPASMSLPQGPSVFITGAPLFLSWHLTQLVPGFLVGLSPLKCQFCEAGDFVPRPELLLEPGTQCLVHSRC